MQKSRGKLSLTVTEIHLKMNLLLIYILSELQLQSQFKIITGEYIMCFETSINM